MRTRYKHIHFQQTILEGVWNCINNKSKEVLATISWYSPWERYVFSQEHETVIFDVGCLKDIIDFINQLPKL
jgi:hypothetical protein